MKRVLIFLVLMCMICATACASTMVCTVHKGEWVWIRNNPSKTADKIGKIRYGYEVEVSEIVDRYAHIKFMDIDGWVDSQYLELPCKEVVYTVISEGPLAKRETPEGRLMCWIKSGARISVLGWRYSPSGELWAKVFKGGYVAARYLELR